MQHLFTGAYEENKYTIVSKILYKLLRNIHRIDSQSVH